MDEIISQSGIEEMAITSFLEIAVFDKAARLFAADKPIVFRLTEKEKLAVQERAMVALRVAILCKQTGDSLRRFAQLLSHSPLYQWFCQINRFSTVKIPGKSTIDDYEKKMGGRRLAPPCFHLRQAGPVVTMGNVGLSHRFGRHSLFQESAKEKPATAGCASVEPEGELFQIRLQMGGND